MGERGHLRADRARSSVSQERGVDELVETGVEEGRAEEDPEREEGDRSDPRLDRGREQRRPSVGVRRHWLRRVRIPRSIARSVLLVARRSPMLGTVVLTHLPPRMPKGRMTGEHWPNMRASAAGSGRLSEP